MRFQNSNEICEFKKQISTIYDEVVHWRKNLFDVPTCKAGKMFVKELANWLEHFNVASVYRCIAVKTFIILPALILQKPSAKSKRSENVQLLTY